MMSDLMPRVILDELVALAVHHLGDSQEARDLVDQVLADHPDLATAAVEAPSPAERLQAVDRLFGRVRWAVRDRLPGVASGAAARPAKAASPAPEPSPAPTRPTSPPWAPPQPQKSANSVDAAPRSLAVPPAATIPQLEPPRTFIPAIVAPGSEVEAEPEARAPEPLGPPLPEVEEDPAAAPEALEPVSPKPAPSRPARPEPIRPESGRPEPIRPAPAPPVQDTPEPAAAPPPPPPAAPPKAPPAAQSQTRMRPRSAPAGEDGPQAPLAPHPSHNREPPPLQVEIVDDLYGIEAATRRRRRVLIGLAGLAVAAGVVWLVVLADLPQVFRGLEWPGSSPESTTAEALPTEGSGSASLEALELESPDLAADQPDEAPANGTRLILKLDQTPEPAAGPTPGPASPGEDSARIFIHYDADAASASAAASALYARLADGAGYATVVLRDVPYAIGSHRVRYYYLDDRPAALALIERLGNPPDASWQLQDFSNYRPLPVRGTLEVFVPTN